jgi:hypothetical protein
MSSAGGCFLTWLCGKFPLVKICLGFCIYILISGLKTVCGAAVHLEFGDGQINQSK